MCSLCKNGRADAHIHNKYIKNLILAPRGQVQVQNWVQLYLSSHLWCAFIWICICLSWLYLEAWNFLWLKKQIIETTGLTQLVSEGWSKVPWSHGKGLWWVQLALHPGKGWSCVQPALSVLTATQKSSGHNTSMAIHDDYHLIKLTWWTDNWVSLQRLHTVRALGRVRFHTQK